jgi:dihydroorotase
VRDVPASGSPRRQRYTLTIRRPDDWHLHLRDGAMLKAVLPETARHFARAIIMPNLVPPVVTAADAAAYRDRILAALPAGMDFTPLMTLYLTETTDPEDVAAAAERARHGGEALPGRRHDQFRLGRARLRQGAPVLERMAEIGLPLCVHGEVTDADRHLRPRGGVHRPVLDPIRRATPGLRVVMEHITTATGSTMSARAATTRRDDHHPSPGHQPQHILLVGGINPHYYCLPVAKRESHRLALRAAATSGDPQLLPRHRQRAACHPLKEAPAAAPAASPRPTRCRSSPRCSKEGALDRLEAFTSLNGPAFYRLRPTRRPSR